MSNLFPCIEQALTPSCLANKNFRLRCAFVTRFFHYNRKFLCIVKILLLERVAKLHRADVARIDVAVVEGVGHTQVELLERHARAKIRAQIISVFANLTIFGVYYD